LAKTILLNHYIAMYVDIEFTLAPNDLCPSKDLSNGFLFPNYQMDAFNYTLHP